MSQRLWGLDFGAEPALSVGDVSLRAEPAEVGLAFLEGCYADIFRGHADGDRFFREPATAAKRRWAEEMDTFVYRREGRVVGLLQGHPTDWSTYYIRMSAILPEARGGKLSHHTLSWICERLASAAVGRVEADVTPTNATGMQILSALGFVVTSVGNHDRWGACLRLTKHLDADAKRAFARQFCALDVEHRERVSPSPIEKGASS